MANKQVKNDMVNDERIAAMLVKQEVVTQEQVREARAQEQVSGVPWIRSLLNKRLIMPQSIEDVLKYEFHSSAEKQRHKNLG